MNKRIITITVIGIALLALMIMKLSANKKEAAKKVYIHDVNEAILVEASQASMHTFESAFTYLGTFDPIRQNTIGSDAQGKIITLNVEEGDPITKGQVIAKVDDELLRLQLENAEIAIEGQQNDDQRYASLAKEKAIAGVQLEKTKLGLRSAEVQKKQIQKQLKSTTITAPYSGTITKKMIDLGSVIGPGVPLVEITDISSLKLTINVPERDIMKFKLNQTVQVQADIYEGRTFTGKISTISVQADKSHNFKIQVVVQNPKQELRAGIYGSATIANETSKTALAVPRKALVGSSKNPQVYVISNGKAVLTSFSAGTSDGEYIEVVSGLTKNDQIIVKGQVNLQDGSFVKTK